MEVICLENEAFYSLIEQVVLRIKEKQGLKEDKWISPEEAMQKLRISSKTTLQKLRDEGKIRFSQPQKNSFFMIVNQLINILKNMQTIHFKMSSQRTIFYN